MNRPKSVSAYFSSLPKEQKAALKRLRKVIRSAAPKATERISYGMPMFYVGGMLVGYAAFKGHCSFFPLSARIIRKFKGKLKGYGTSKGTIHFTPEKPLPASLVKKIVRARIKEKEAKRKK